MSVLYTVLAVLAFLILTAGTAVFVSAEFSLTALERSTVDANARTGGRRDLLVQRAIRRAGHCNFSDQERVQGFEDLVQWAEQGEKPGGDDILGDLSDAGRAYTNPRERNDPGGITPAQLEESSCPATSCFCSSALPSSPPPSSAGRWWRARAPARRRLRCRTR